MKVSVIIPSYNHKNYILKAIDSVLEQTYKNFELIVIDDGSTDNSIEIIEAVKDNRINILTQPNRGAHAAINRGLEIATGDYIAILNSDDLFQDNRLDLVLGKMIEENADFASTWIDVIDEYGRSKGIKMTWKNMQPWSPEVTINKSNELENYYENLIFSNFISTTSNMIFKRSVIDAGYRMRGFKFVHDWDFALRVASKFYCIVVEEPLLKYRSHQSNTIKSAKKEMLYEIMLLLASNINIIGSKLIKHDSYVSQAESLSRLNSLLAYQGNERLFISFYLFLQQLESVGVVNPVEYVLNNKEVKNELMKFVQDEP